MTIGRRVSENNTMTFTVRSGRFSLFNWGLSSLENVTSSTISVGLINAGGWSVDATSGVELGQISADYGHTVLGGVKLRLGGNISSQGNYSTTISAERRITEHTRAGLSLDVGTTMILKLRVNRLGQRIVFPVIVSSTTSISLVVAFTAVPSLSMLAAHYYIILPQKRRRVAK